MPIAADLVPILYDAAHRLPTYVSVAAAVGCLFLLVLYLSQRRDLMRLRAWMAVAPSAGALAALAVLDGRGAGSSGAGSGS